MIDNKHFLVSGPSTLTGGLKDGMNGHWHHRARSAESSAGVMQASKNRLRIRQSSTAFARESAAWTSTSTQLEDNSLSRSSVLRNPLLANWPGRKISVPNGPLSVILSNYSDD